MTPVAESGRHTAADISREVERLRNLAAGVVDDGVHAAQRTLKSVQRGVEHLGDLKDDAVHEVKRHPLQAVGIALGVGLVLGTTIGWLLHRPSRPE